MRRFKSKTSALVVMVHKISDSVVQWEGLEDFPFWGCHYTNTAIFMGSMEEVQS